MLLVAFAERCGEPPLLIRMCMDHRRSLSEGHIDHRNMCMLESMKNIALSQQNQSVKCKKIQAIQYLYLLEVHSNICHYPQV